MIAYEMNVIVQQVGDNMAATPRGMFTEMPVPNAP